MRCAGVSQHPAVLLDLGYGDALGRVNYQHLPDQILTVCQKGNKDRQLKKGEQRQADQTILEWFTSNV